MYDQKHVYQPNNLHGLNFNSFNEFDILFVDLLFPRETTTIMK